ncbi:MAG: hypothetical protein ABI542_07700 [Gemmatimonadota bacterium]
MTVTCPKCKRVDGTITGIEVVGRYDGVAYWWCPTEGCGAFPRADGPGGTFFARQRERRCAELGTDPTIIPQPEPDSPPSGGDS